jgi:hypothetical protein
VRRITLVLGANENYDPPDIIGAAYKLVEGGHRPDDIFTRLPAVALLLEADAPKDNQSEKGVIVTSINPDVIGQRRTHTPAAATPVATTARISLIQLFTLRDDVNVRVLVRIRKLTFWPVCH